MHIKSQQMYYIAETTYEEVICKYCDSRYFEEDGFCYNCAKDESERIHEYSEEMSYWDDEIFFFDEFDFIWKI